MRIAVEGCGHGTLHSIYASVAKACEINGWQDGIKLLIIGGDFQLQDAELAQAVRNSHDLLTMSVPAKYRAIGDFHEYYSGARTAPYLTLFVGGNHEASSHLMELYYGGWVAPNIYYLGAAAVVRFGTLRIAGLSGIWNGGDYRRPHSERLPYRYKDIKSAYHVREWDVRKLLQVRRQVDVGISHDWPRSIEWKGNWKALFRDKVHFEKDAREGKLGSVAAKVVMERLRPGWWFSAHMHCKFAAVVKHGPEEKEEVNQVNDDQDADLAAQINGFVNPHEISISDNEIEEASENPETRAPVKNSDEIDLDMDDDEEANGEAATVSKRSPPPPGSSSDSVPEAIRAQLPASFAKPKTQSPPGPQLLPPPSGIKNTTTHFLALDKPLPNRKFLQLLDIESISDSTTEESKEPQLSYDKEWLAITRVFAKEADPTSHFPNDKGQAYYARLIDAEEEWVEQNVVQKDRMVIPENFERTAPIYDPAVGLYPKEQVHEYTNPQTVAFSEMLQIPNHFDASEEDREKRRRDAPPQDEDQGGRGGRGGGWNRGGSHRGHGRGGRGRGRGGRGYN